MKEIEFPDKRYHHATANNAQYESDEDRAWNNAIDACKLAVSRAGVLEPITKIAFVDELGASFGTPKVPTVENIHNEIMKWWSDGELEDTGELAKAIYGLLMAKGEE